MRSAPSVAYPVGRSHWYGRCLGVIGLLGWLASGLCWLLPVGDPSAAMWSGGMAGLMAASWSFWALWDWRRSPEGLLIWGPGTVEPGQAHAQGCWSWQPVGRLVAAQTCQVAARLDLQSRQLLQVRMDASGAAHWVWVEAGRDPGRWQALRRALVSARA